jgi:glutamyl-tRNA reductase
MLDIVLIGINHKTASIELRECLAFSEEDTLKTFSAFKNNPVIKEIMLISTCNRVELLITTPNPDEAIQIAKQHLSESKRMALKQFEDSLYIHQGDDAIRHIFRVASSLDSLIVGEPQILGQIKAAYRKPLFTKHPELF